MLNGLVNKNVYSSACSRSYAVGRSVDVNRLYSKITYMYAEGRTFSGKCHIHRKNVIMHICLGWDEGCELP
jgi:hypothetical protein